MSTYAPLFPVRPPERPVPDCESTMITGAGERWLFHILWRDEEDDGTPFVIEHCDCMKR